MEGGLNMNSILKILVIMTFIVVVVALCVRDGNAGDDIRENDMDFTD